MEEEYVVHEESIITRERARGIIDEVESRNLSKINLSNVDFISRSVADELIASKLSGEVELVGLNTEVERMIKAVQGDKIRLAT